MRYLALILLALPLSATAHENEISVSVEGAMTCIRSNGVPDHQMGRFPNRANPNSFRLQTLTFCFPTDPELAAQTTSGLMTVGVTLSGVPIRPYTAGYYDPDGRRGLSHDPSSGWRQQAMYDPRSLGMDDQNAHVDRSGLYHYHGVASASLLGTRDDLIGYAPDGFEIRYAPTEHMSSWQLKSGTRPSAPGGQYDGRFEEDFTYVAGSGTLDECNGVVVNGTYTYYATDTYPYFPRCFKGVVNEQFIKRR